MQRLKLQGILFSQVMQSSAADSITVLLFLRYGPDFRGDDGPNNPMIGVPTALAMCIGPVSQLTMSWAC